MVERESYRNGNPCMIALNIANLLLDCMSSGSGPATIFNKYNECIYYIHCIMHRHNKMNYYLNNEFI